VELSTDSTGDYLNLEQGVGETWSTLYNAYYETVIGVSLVPEQVAANQASFYLNQLTTYGMPLESDAGNLNKVAWLMFLPAWLSSYPIAGELMSRNVAYINDTPSLVPYGDRYDTSTGIEITGIQAHPTLGAVFAILAAESVSSGTGSDAPVAGTEAPTQPTASSTSGSSAQVSTSNQAVKPVTQTVKRRRKKPKPKPKHKLKPKHKPKPKHRAKPKPKPTKRKQHL
jgi:hypothetical protein